MLVPAATLTNANSSPASGPPDAASSSDPTTSSGQLSSEGQISILYPGLICIFSLGGLVNLYVSI